MKHLIFAVVVLTICSHSYAQLRKCVAPDGRVTYSDVLCSGGSTSGTIKNPNGNTLDTSGFREQAEKRDIAGGMQNAPIECQFKSYESDEKSKVLANQAKAECVKNIYAAKKGIPMEKDAYQMWKDYYEQAESVRQARKNRASAFLNANKTPKCFSSGTSITCK